MLVLFFMIIRLFSDFIRPVCLPDVQLFPDYNFTDGSGLYVAGWGRSETGYASIVKLKLKVPIYNFEKCGLEYAPFNITLSPCQVCTLRMVYLYVKTLLLSMSILVMCWRRAGERFVQRRQWRTFDGHRSQYRKLDHIWNRINWSELVWKY